MKHGFRLGVVLRLREAAELSARANLAEAIRAHRERVAIAAQLVAEVRAEEARLVALQARSGQEAGVVAGEIRETVDTVGISTQARIEADAGVSAAALAVLESRERLAETTRQRQLVERLRDRFRLAETLEDERREGMVLDELGSVRHSWRALEEAER